MNSPRAYVNPNWLKDSDDMITSILSSCRSVKPNEFHVDSGKLLYDSRQLRIPGLIPESVYYNAMTGKTKINIDEWNLDDFESASSIGKFTNFEIPPNKMRTFAHDFTFAILSEHEERKLCSIFPHVADGADNLTPDVVIEAQGLTLIMEFCTNQSDDKFNLSRDRKRKEDKYFYPLKLRFAQWLPDHQGGVFSYSVLAISQNWAILPNSLEDTVASRLCAELCARYRFALQILHAAKMQGLVIEDTQREQDQRRIKDKLCSIQPKWQHEEDGLRVPLTLERIDTSDLSEGEAYNRALDSYTTALKKAMPKAVKSFVKRQEADGQVSEGEDFCTLLGDYKNKYHGTRMDLKPVLQLPTCLPNPDSGWLPHPCYEADPHSTFIDSIITARHESGWEDKPDVARMEQLSECLESDPAYLEALTRRRKYKRVIVKPTEEQALLFAMDGVLGKSHSDHPLVKACRDKKSESFSVDVSDADIRYFLDHPYENENPRPLLLRSQEDALLLIRSALDQHLDTKSLHIDVIKALLKLPLLQWCSFIATIAQELAISIKQNTNRDEWIFKRVPEFDCFLIVKPTSSNSHIFFRLVMPVDSDSILPMDLGRSNIVTSTYSYTPWCSFTVDKLTNIIKIESFVVTMLAQWSRYYGVDITEDHQHQSAWFMTRVCMLVTLEDRSGTEEILTLFRYVAMEKFSILTPDNRKMLPKLPLSLRSRLQSWAVRTILFAMSGNNYVPIGVDQDVADPSNSTYMWRYMINPFNGETIKEPSKLIELFYIGYCTNKNSKCWANAEFDLIKKIIEYEEKLSEARPEFCGMQEDPPDGFRFFEWSRSMVCASADHFKRHLRQNYGAAWLDKIEGSILQRLANSTWEDLATLKASSVFDPSNPESGMILKGKKTGKVFSLKREKLALRVMSEIDKYEDKPVLSVPELLELVEEEGGLIVDIFKKPQHGGIREIYVLEMKSRVVQYTIEEISRALCLELPNEVMMHPEMKFSKPQDHMYKSAVDPAPYKMNLSSSNDAKVWNQSHHVAKFAQFLCRILPPEWHGLVVNTLSLWTTKQIRMPDGVLNIMKRHPHLRMHDDVHKKIHSAYTGKETYKWHKFGTNHVVIESGMMQGILHYLSSLFHGCLLLLRDAFWKKVSTFLGVKSETTDLCSSDDSCRMTDIFCHDKDNFQRALILAMGDHMAITEISSMGGIWMSPKCTFLTRNLVEFNSEFVVRASLLRPMIKFVFAALTLSITESFSERFELFYSLIEQVLGGGSGFRVSHVVQVGQAMLHYRMMGSSANPLFSRFTSLLLDVKDPSLGYMPLDPPLVTGLPGHQYSLWNLCNLCEPFNKTCKKMLMDPDRTTTSSGSITKGVQIRFGDRKKVKRLFEAADTYCPNWLESINEAPEILYKRSETKEEAKQKIVVKLTSPGVIQSFSRGNEVANLMASSVYVVNGLSITLGSNWVDIVKDRPPDVQRSKVSLMHLVKLDRTEGEFLTALEMRTIFPHSDIYAEFQQSLKGFKDFTLTLGGSRKTHRTHVQVFSKARSYQFSLSEMVQKKWFDKELIASPESIDYCWESYKTVYPWLHENPSTCLKNSPFENHIQLHNMVTKETGKTRRLNLTGTPVKDTRIRDVVLTVIMKNQIPGREFVSLDDEEMHLRTYRKGVSLVSGIARILEFPQIEEVKLDVIVRLLQESPKIWSGEDARPSDQMVKLGVIQSFVKECAGAIDGSQLTQEQTERLTKIALSSGLGVLGGFTVRQTLNPDTKEHEGKGTWKGRIDHVPLEINMEDKFLISIVTTNLDEFSKIAPSLRRLLKDFGLTSFRPNLTNGPSFNLTYLTKGNLGAKVTVQANMTAPVTVKPREWRLALFNNKLRIEVNAPSKPKRGQRASYRRTGVITHAVHMGDAGRADPVFPECNAYLKAWVSGDTIPVRIAEGLLSIKRHRLFDLESKYWKEFCRSTLLLALKRQGIHFNAPAMLLPKIIEDDEAIMKEANYLLNEFDFSTVMIDIDSILAEREPELTELDLNHLLDAAHMPDINDLLEVETYSQKFQQVVSNTRYTTKIWDAWAKSWSEEKLRPSDKIKLSQGIKTPQSEELAEIISRYTDLTFVSKEPFVWSEETFPGGWDEEALYLLDQSGIEPPEQKE